MFIENKLSLKIARFVRMHIKEQKIEVDHDGIYLSHYYLDRFIIFYTTINKFYDIDIATLQTITIECS